MKQIFNYAARHVDGNGFTINSALLTGFSEKPLKPGSVVTDGTGTRFKIDFCFNSKPENRAGEVVTHD